MRIKISRAVFAVNEDCIISADTNPLVKGGRCCEHQRTLRLLQFRYGGFYTACQHI
jgi:hypothetical protein